MSIQEYNVAFGPHAWDVEYQDGTGKYTFVFDVDYDALEAKGPVNRLLLQKGPPLKNMKSWECRTQADLEHIQLMLERVKHYLESLRYIVRII